MRVTCKHCGRRMTVAHSAFTTGREKGEAVLASKDYHPATKKRYKTSETLRRTSLAYYYRNREKVLAREKLRRQRLGTVTVKMSEV